METLDDAGVYRLRDDLAVIQTVDFFTPIVDDPHRFGEIAVANSLSDVYAMGGRPLTAMNIVCFPTRLLEISVLQEILRGGVEKMGEAGVTLVGGHSIDDTELKYGLSVTGVIHPDRLVTTSGARPGDKIIITKPLGTGIVGTAIKAGVAGAELVEKVSLGMAALNNKASELMLEAGAHACTDITGFGFVGHALKIARNSGIGMEMTVRSIPHYPEIIDLYRRGLCPGGLYRNREFYSASVTFAPLIPEELQDILFDAQTSGGLLICVPPAAADNLVDRLRREGVSDAVIVGEAVSEHAGHIRIA